MFSLIDLKFLDPNVLVLKVARFADIATNFDISSKPVYISGLQWKLNAKGKVADKYVNLCIYCNSGPEDKNWTCTASISVRIKSHKEGNPEYSQTRGHQLFAPSSESYTSYCFMRIDVSDIFYSNKILDYNILGYT